MLKKFIKFPDELYKDCEQYVPALHSDQVFSLTKDPALDYCKHKLWLAFDGKKIVGQALIVNLEEIVHHLRMVRHDQ